MIDVRFRLLEKCKIGNEVIRKRRFHIDGGNIRAVKRWSGEYCGGRGAVLCDVLCIMCCVLYR